jgi:hypothetical protein
LSTRPEETVALLNDKLKPFKLDSLRLKAYLLRLGSSNEAVWKKAFEDLEYYDPRLAMDLQALMDKVADTPVRQRLVEVLSCRDPGSLQGQKITLRNWGNFFTFGSDRVMWRVEHKVARINTVAWITPKRKWTRAVRAIVLLEHIGTPEALVILKDMATGHPDAQPTKVAKEALDRPTHKARRDGTRPRE